MRIKWNLTTSCALGAVLMLASCGNSSVVTGSAVASGSGASAGSSNGSGSAVVLPACGSYPFPSPEWTQCEQQNYAKTQEAANEEIVSPSFQQRWQTQSTANAAEWAMRAATDPTWLSPLSGNTALLPLCTTWSLQCAGDPFRAAAGLGSDGAAFYTSEAEVTPVVFYDDACARLSGRIWKPKGAVGPLPAVVIQNGSVQAPETLYWWAAQALVRAGYVVMTFDPRGQGRSDQQTPTGAQGSNANSTVFWTGLVNAIDFFRSTSVQPYPHNLSCAGTYATKITSFNPYASVIDRDRLGIAGHSLGGVGVSVVQAYGAAAADPWPGKIDKVNPVKAVVAWDGIFTQQSGSAGNAGGKAESTSGAMATPVVVPQFPILGINSEYGLTPQPFTQPPNPAKATTNFRVWHGAKVPALEMTIRGSTHYEFSLLPTFPATSWCPDAASGHCSGGWGNAFAEHYTLAWFDRWLKKPGESGYNTADARLLDDAGVNGVNKLSFYYRSARDFPTRAGQQQFCEDIKKGC